MVKAVLELPVARDGFGGIVGSRIEIRSVSEVLVQIAYLDKGETARVRYTEKRLLLDIEQPTKAVELRLADVQVMGGDTTKTRLQLDIVCAGEKQ